MSEAGRTVGERAAFVAREALERVLLAVPDAVLLGVSAPDVAARLRRAIAALYITRDTSELATAHLEGLGEAQRTSLEIAALLQERAGVRVDEVRPMLDDLARAERVLAPAFDAVAHEQARRRNELSTGEVHDVMPEPRPLRASSGTPQLHAILRRPLEPTLAPREDEAPVEVVATPVPATPRPTSLAALSTLGATLRAQVEREVAGRSPEVLPEEGTLPWVGFEPRLEEIEVLRRFGRDALEDIALSRTLRVQNELEKWTDVAPFEQRLLDQLDALASYGPPALAQVPLALFEDGGDDPDAAFAASIAYGCIDGSDTIGVLLFDLKQCAPEAHPGFVEGLALASNPRIDGWLADLARSDNPAWAGLALDVLERRGTTPPELAMELREAEARGVRIRALRALGRVGERGASVAALELALGASHGDRELELAVVESMLERRHPALGALRALAASADAAALEAWIALAIAGGPADGERVLAALGAHPDVRLAHAVGRHGAFGTIEGLVHLLPALDGEVRMRAVEGLELATGAGLVHTVREPWPVDLPPGVEPENVYVPERVVTRVIDDPDAWRAWLDARGPALRAAAAGARGTTRKLRGGRLFTPGVAVAEILSESTPAYARGPALREVRWATGALTHVWLGDWVARQRTQLDALAIEVARSGFASGAWLSSDAYDRVASPSSAPPAPSLSAPSFRAPSPPAVPPVAVGAQPTVGTRTGSSPAIPAVVGAPALSVPAPSFAFAPPSIRAGSPLTMTAPPSVHGSASQAPTPFKSPLTMTAPPSVSADAARGATPFVAAPPSAPAPAAAPPASVRTRPAIPDSLTGTQPQPPLQTTMATPFASGTLAPSSTQPPATAPPSALPWSGGPARSATPVPGAGPQAAPAKKRVDSGTMMATFSPTGPALPFASPSDVKKRVPLAMYASIRAELESRPTSVEAVLMRYGVRDAASWSIVVSTWESTFSTEPALRVQFDEMIARARSALR